jgi:hypothetical protein
VKHKKDLDDHEAIPEARDEIRTFAAHSFLKSSDAHFEDALVGSYTISALVPVPPSCRDFAAVGRSDLKSICSRELHSVATFSDGTVIGGGSGTVTSEKGIWPKFGRTNELRGDSNRRGTDSEEVDFRDHSSFSGAFDRTKGESISDAMTRQEKTNQEEDEKRRSIFAEPPPATAFGPTISRG